jgi:hypothetical protein
MADELGARRKGRAT